MGFSHIIIGITRPTVAVQFRISIDIQSGIVVVCTGPICNRPSVKLLSLIFIINSPDLVDIRVSDETGQVDRRLSRRLGQEFNRHGFAASQVKGSHIGHDFLVSNFRFVHIGHDFLISILLVESSYRICQCLGLSQRICQTYPLLGL